MQQLLVNEIIQYPGISTDDQTRFQNLAIKRVALGLDGYLAQFGILDIGELNRDQLLAFVAARNLESCVDILGMPTGKNRQTDRDAYLKEHLNNRPTSFPFAFEAFRTVNSVGEYEVRSIRNLDELRLLLPHELLLSELAPDEFLRRLADEDLLVRTRAPRPPQQIDHNEDATVTDNAAAEADALSPVARVVLDGSESMSNPKDRRGIVAKGFALAFELRAFRANCNVSFRAFNTGVSELIEGSSEADFRAIVRAILGLHFEGQTDIQNALFETAHDNRTPHSASHILLLTDGMSRLRENPLENATLHTFVFASEDPSDDRAINMQRRDSLNTLREWSDSFGKVLAPSLAKALVPLSSDVLMLQRYLESLEDDLKNIQTAQGFARIRSRIKNIEYLHNELISEHGTPNSGPLADFHDALRNGIKLIHEFDQSRIGESNSIRTDSDKKRLREIETMNLSSPLEGDLTFTIKGSDGELRHISPFDFMLAIFMKAKAAVDLLVKREGSS